MDSKNCWYRGVCSQAPGKCSNTCVRFIEMATLCRLSNIPESKWRPVQLTAGDDYDEFIRLKEIKYDIENWVKTGNSLYLFSDNFGNGKTSWSIKLMLAYFNAVWAGNGFRRRGVFVSVPEFLDRNRETINNRDEAFVELRQDILSCDLVVWDDITSTKLSEFNHAMLLNYIDARALAGKSNIYTGNVDEEGMVQYLGGRLTSRIWNTSEVIQFYDVDKRRIAHG